MKKLIFLITLLLATQVQAQTVRSTYTDYCEDAVGCWRFNEDAGFAVDESGNDAHATIDGATYTSTGCLEGSCYDFDGANDLLNFTLTHSAQISMCLWIEIDAQGDTQYGRLIEGTGYPIYANLAANKEVSLESKRDDTQGNWDTDTDTIVYGTGFHFCVTYDSSNTANDPIFYKNGSSINVTREEAPIGNQLSNAGEGYFGNRAAKDRSLDGSLDEILIRDDILTPTEILDIYKNGLR